MRSIFVSHWSISPNMMFIHQISFKILCKITDTKYRSLTYVNFMRSTFLSLIHYIKYDLHPSNSLKDTRLNHWTMKYRSLTYIYFMWSIFVSHWFITLSVTFIHQIVFKIQSKITGPWNIGHWPIYILCSQSLCHTDPLYQVWHSSIK